MAIFQLIRANDDKLTPQTLKTNLLCWNDFTRTNPLAPQKLTQETQRRLSIEDDLPWIYQFSATGEPIAIDVAQLLTTVGQLDHLLYRYRYNTPTGLLPALEESSAGSGSTALAVKTEGSIALSTRLLIENLIGATDKPSEVFLHISNDHVTEMSKILALLDNQAISVKGRMEELTKGETTAEKYAQVATLLEIESLLLSAEMQSLRLIHEIATRRGALGVHIDQIKRLGKKRGDYFFINLNVKW
jgi:hypothetical protein